MIIECKNCKFIFEDSVPQNKIHDIANKIVEFCNENSVDFSLLDGDSFDGILTCPISLKNTDNGIEVKILIPCH